MSASTPKATALLQCIQHLLKPLLRLCVRHSVKIHELMELIKIEYVRAAQTELKRKTSQASASRVSVMTGVHRKDVTRILKNPDTFNPQDNIVAKVMLQWQHDGRFRTKAGTPRVLSMEGKQSEFYELVSSVNGGDLSPYALLYEMERMGVVERKGSSLRLMWRDFAPEPTVRSGLEMLARDAIDLFESVEGNIFEREEIPNLHLKTVMDNVIPSALPTIRRWLLEEGSLFQRKVRSFLAQFDCDLNPTLRGRAGGVRVALGTFSVVTKG